MNTKEPSLKTMTQILNANGYRREDDIAEGKKIWKWAKDGEIVSWTNQKGSIWHMTHAAYKHQQEALEAQVTQAANDLAGEAAYEETISFEEIEFAIYPDKAENAQLRAEIEALKAENLRYQAGLKRLVAAMDAITRYPVDWNTFGHIRNQANDILVVINQAANPAPTAQAASEVPAALDKPFYSVKEHVETMYKTDEYSGKRYPSDYSIFTVVNHEGIAIDSFSALEHGLDDAEYLANELRDKLNKAVQS